MRHSPFAVPVGIPEWLAAARAARVHHLHYALFFDIPRNPDLPVAGQATVTFTLADGDEGLALDFQAPPSALHHATLNGEAVPLSIERGHVLLPPEHLRTGGNTLSFRFDAGSAPLNRRDDGVYTVLVPARAHELFPCFDQPDLKAGFSLTLVLPDDWEAVANAPERQRRLEMGADGRQRLVVSFDDTDPLPTYLFAFAAGPFAIETAFRAGRMLRMFHREPDEARVARNRRAIVDQHMAALDWLEQYTGMPYPFAKLDIVLVPAFQFGGMEHPGAIFYNAASLLLEASPTRQQELARAHLVAHETAHMWFGNLVTMTWFGDVWMKEVFANVMAARIVEPAFGDVEHDLRFLLTHYPGAYDVDRTAGSHPIRQTLEDLADAGSLYGALIYLKSPIVLRQLERRLGTTGLRDALREYLRRFAFSNAAWPDLVAILAEREASAPVPTDGRDPARDIRAFCHDWIDAAGRPALEVSDVASGSRPRVRLARAPRQALDAAPDGPRWPQQLEVAFGFGGEVDHVSCAWTGEAIEVESPRQATPDFVLPNGRGLAYGAFALTESSRTWLLAHLPAVADPLTRASAWLTLWDEMLDGRIAPTLLLETARAAVRHEPHELLLQRVLMYTERLFWSYLRHDQRHERAAALEDALRQRLDSAESPSARAALFGACRATALTATAVSWLRDVWSGRVGIEGLILGEQDHVALAQELAVRGGPDADAILLEQVERMPEGERRDALRFVMPALSNDVAQRWAFFERLGHERHRRREPWVVDGLRWLHHPLRQRDALPFVRPGLDLLEDVKRTGDIFLPKRWLDATLGGHASAEAAAVVRGFLEARGPALPPRLRLMVLASADHLFRAAALTAR